MNKKDHRRLKKRKRALGRRLGRKNYSERFGTDDEAGEHRL